MAERGVESAPAELGLSDLFGLRGPAAWLFLVALEITIVLSMARTFGSSALPAAATATGLLVVCGVLVLAPAPDPLPWPATAFVTLAGPVATVLTTVDADPDGARTVWTAFASSYVLAVLVLRGRLVAAWVGVAGIATAVVAVASTTAPGGTLVAGSVVPVATVAGVSLCVAVMRPTQRSLRLLHEEATSRAAAEAALVAEHSERDRQLARLDAVARPILERIADGSALTAADREQCRLLEAELRDGLRAPQLVTEALSSAARGARARGVEVLLLDDGGFTGAPAWIRDRVIVTATGELDAANAGAVTVRVLPTGRRVLATVLATDGETDRRTEIDAAGAVSVIT